MRKRLSGIKSIFCGLLILSILSIFVLGVEVESGNQYGGSPYKDYYNTQFIPDSGKIGYSATGTNGVTISGETVQVEVDYSKITPETTVITKDMLKVTYWDSNTERNDVYEVKETKDYQFRHNQLSEALTASGELTTICDYNKVNFLDDENYVYIYVGAYYDNTPGNQKYYAVEKAIPIQYSTVSFKLQGGNVNDSDQFNDQIVIYNQKIKEPNVDPEKTSDTNGNYHFVGWNTRADGKGAFWNFNDTVTKSMTLYAIWTTEPVYQVRFLKNYNPDEIQLLDEKTLSNGNNYQLIRPDNPERVSDTGADYSFVGWNTKADGTGDYWNFNDKVTKSMDLYAIWTTESIYQVRFMKNDNTDTVVETQTPSKANNYQLTRPETNPTRVEDEYASYSFVGWNTKADGTGNFWNFNDKVTKNMDLYAIWSREPIYQVHFMRNYEPSDQTVYLAQNISVSNNYLATQPANPVRSSEPGVASYSFVGWNTRTDGKGSYWNFYDRVTSDMTLYAIWTTEPIYQVRFMKNDNTLTLVDIQTLPKGNNYQAVQPNNPKRNSDADAEYAFLGWNTKPDGTGDNWNFNDRVTKNMTLYAIWEEIPIYHVKFMVFGEEKSRQDVKESMKYLINRPEDPKGMEDAYAKYSFAGWNTREDGTGDTWNFDKDVVIRDLTLYAQWKIEYYYTMKYYDGFSKENEYSSFTDYIYAVNGKKEPVKDFKGYYIMAGEERVLESQKLRIGVPAFQRVDYTFEGWYMDDGEKYDPKKSLEENIGEKLTEADEKKAVINLTARWSSLYKGSSSVEIDTETLEQGMYKSYYSDYIEAYAANRAGNRVYRNFVLTNSKGQVRGDISTLPQGLYMNERTGEVYGVPEKAGEYTFYVRLSDDEGNWISSVSKIMLTIAKSTINVSFAENVPVYQKIYGEDDPSGLYHSGDSGLKVEAASSDYHNTEYSHTNGDNTYRIHYNYSSQKNAHYADGFEENTEKMLSQLDKAPDLADKKKTFVPASSTDVFKVSLKREKGEDAKVYKRYAQMAGDEIQNYTLELGGLKDTGHVDEKGKEYPQEYFFKIQKKAIKYVNDSANGKYIYGELAGGSEIFGGEFKENDGLVTKKTFDRFDGYQVDDVENISVQKQPEKWVMSGAGKLKAGRYSQSTGNVIHFASSNQAYSDTTGANNATASRDTSDNYIQNLKLYVYQRNISLKGHTVQAYTNNDVTAANVRSLASLSGVLKNDNVSYANAKYIIKGITYTSPEKAAAALTKLAQKAGDYKVYIQVEKLSGADAPNYKIDSTVEATLHVKDAVLLAYAKTNFTRNVTLTWNQVPGADRYIVYGGRCGSKLKKLATVKATSKLSFTQKSLRRHKSYKYYVVALRGNRTLAESFACHATVGKVSGKYADASKIIVKNTSLTVAVGKTIKVSAQVKNYRNKKSYSEKHDKKLRYKTADNSIASVSSNGVIKGKKPGVTTVYVQAINGMWKAVKVYVK